MSTETENTEDLDDFFKSLSSLSSAEYVEIIASSPEKKNLKKLVESVKNKWDILVKYSNDVIITSNKELIIDFINKRELRFLHRSSILEWIHPDDIDRMKKAIEKVSQEKTSTSLECKEKTGNFYDCKLTPQITGGSIVGFILIASDINEKKHGQQLLAESEERYRSFFGRNLAGLYRVSFDKVIIECNDEFAKILGYNNSEEATGKFAPNLFEKNNGESIIDLLSKENNLKGYEHEIELENGEKKWIVENTSVVQSAISGKKIIEGSVFEITELKKVRLQLDSQAKFPEVNPNPVFRLNTNLEILYVNKAGTAILYDLIIEGKLIGDLKKPIYKALEIKESIEIELKVGTKYFLFSIKPVWDDETYINIYLRDISQRKRGEILNEVSFKILRVGIFDSLTLSDYCEIIKSELSELFDTSYMYYSMLNKKGRVVNPEEDKTTSVHDKKGVEKIYLNQYLIKEGKAFLLDKEDLLSLENNHAIFLPKKLCEQLISVPIMEKNIPIGVLVIKLFDKKQKFSIGDLKMMEHISNLLSEVLEKTKINKLLIKREEEFRGLVERNLSGVYRLNIEGKILDCNDAFAEIIGYKSKEDVIGKNCRRLYKNLTDINFLQRVIDNGRALKGYECNLLLNNGKKVWVLENVSIIYNKRKWPKYMEGTMMDITEQKSNVIKLEEEKKSALELQSKLLSSQINPHFIFNSMNSIQYYILEQQIEPALNYVSEFSSLMRQSLNNSQHKYITLKEEIEFLTSYLRLGEKRFKGKFSFDINAADIIIEDELIPPMLLQPYIENSIIHGIGNIKENGIIKIKFKHLTKFTMLCQIEDNGIGRKKAEELKQLKKGPTHKSLAMKITNTRLEILRELEDSLYTVKIEDLIDENRSSIGTRINILIPRRTESEMWD